MVIATKCRISTDNPMDPFAAKPNSFGLSRKHIMQAVEASLKRLQTDHIDLYQVTTAMLVVLLKTFFFAPSVQLKFVW